MSLKTRAKGIAGGALLALVQLAPVGTGADDAYPAQQSVPYTLEEEERGDESETPHDAKSCPTCRSFRAIFDEETPHIRAIARRLGVRAGDIDDVVNDVFVVVHRRWEDFDTSRSEHAWVGGIARHVAVAYTRGAYHRRCSAADVSLRPDTQAPLETQFETEERKACVLEALQALDPALRELLTLHVLQERAMPEVARLLSLNINTAYARLKLARERFAGLFTRKQNAHAWGAKNKLV